MVYRNVTRSSDFWHLSWRECCNELSFSLSSWYKGFAELNQFTTSYISMFDMLWSLQSRTFYCEVTIRQRYIQWILEAKIGKRFLISHFRLSMMSEYQTANSGHGILSYKFLSKIHLKNYKLWKFTIIYKKISFSILINQLNCLENSMKIQRV